MNRHSLILSFALVASWAVVPTSWADNPLAASVEMDYSGKADSLTTAFVGQFLNTSRGTFWAVPYDRPNRDDVTTDIYWQQAHAMDVLIYSYERIKDTDAATASRYERYMKLWYACHANNWYRDDSDMTGFLNEFTDDMCWICLTLLHMSEALDRPTYANTARIVFDNYIMPRGWRDEQGFWGLPWKSNFMERNACTNAPGSLVASKLFLRYGDEKYKQAAIEMCTYLMNEMKTKLNNDGRVEEPPLTYTQGTFSEACRQLYHITGDASYLTTAQRVMNYMLNSPRCTHNGLLRDEGDSMDQSIFKAVAMPYAVNMVLDESVSMAYRRTFLRYLQNNAKALWNNLDLSTYPAMYCNFYWGSPVDPTRTPSMGAMASGASLMESVARMASELTKGEHSGIRPINQEADARMGTGSVVTLDGRLLSRHAASVPLPSGTVYIVGRKKVMGK